MSMTPTRFLTALVIAGSTLGLVACGSKSSSTRPVDTAASEDLNVQVSASTVSLLYGTSLSFSSGVPAFGTDVPTSVTFAANDTSAETPVFNIATETDTASGVTTFGSCIFTITASTFEAPSPLAVDSTVTVDPCTIPVPTKDKVVGESYSDLSAPVVFGTASSAAITLPPVVVGSTGVVTVGEIEVGTVPVSEVTGAN